MTIKIWLWNLDKCSGLMKSCLHAKFMLLVVNYSYNIVDMTRILILNFMHKFKLQVTIWWSKLGTMTVFRPEKIFTWDL